MNEYEVSQPNGDKHIVRADRMETFSQWAVFMNQAGDDEEMVGAWFEPVYVRLIDERVASAADEAEICQ